MQVTSRVHDANIRTESVLCVLYENLSFTFPSKIPLLLFLYRFFSTFLVSSRLFSLALTLQLCSLSPSPQRFLPFPVPRSFRLPFHFHFKTSGSFSLSFYLFSHNRSVEKPDRKLRSGLTFV